ncbi:DUF6236 family protein [Sagittula salina]|uniref:Uncharacterized protein n=1 Tax=Sagittula salina TaxID=2820268 RepID=A0A940S4D6_9RHOB|nr:DUF6236 family protein [Sagittula salina]MBP0483979.1 hypothetical protein [Sagittula salina]
MGEAKHRKAIDPYYGKKPKYGRGILLSPPMVYDGKKVVLQSSSIDPGELRRSALFWDRLVWPDSAIISTGSNIDEEFLKAEGLLTRPRPTRYNQEAGLGGALSLTRLVSASDITVESRQVGLFVQQHVEEFLDLERAEPGQWTMAQGEGSLVMENEKFVKGRGQLVKLSRAIPLPDPGYPLQDLLEFKEKRQSEIIGLTHELDKFFSQVASAKDGDFELARLLRVVDRQCCDMIKVAKESKRRFRLGDLSFSLSLDSFESAVKRVAAWEAAGIVATGLPIVGGVLGGATSLVSISRGIGAREITARDNPFRVVGTIHKELV